MLAVGIMAVVMMFGYATIVIAGYLAAAHQARAAADLAALSGASAIAAGEDGCARAGTFARKNKAAVLNCERVGDQIDFVITVRVRVDVPTRVRGLPRWATATGHAGPE